MLAQVKPGNSPKFKVMLSATSAIQIAQRDEVIPWRLLAFSSLSIFPIYIPSEEQYSLDGKISKLDLVSQT